MSRFWTGFGTASALWLAAGAALFFVGGYGPPAEPEPEPIAEAPEEVEAEPEPEPRRRRRRRRRRRAAAGGRTPSGNATTGDDDLGEGEMRTLDMEGSGGEQQLRSGQIEAGFDGAMGRIRRCLFLIEGDGDVRGTVTFALRIAPSGQVERVQLSGPRAATAGEAGTCMRTAARGIRFDSFDGPPQVVRYPLHLE